MAQSEESLPPFGRREHAHEADAFDWEAVTPGPAPRARDNADRKMARLPARVWNVSKWANTILRSTVVFGVILAIAGLLIACGVFPYVVIILSKCWLLFGWILCAKGLGQSFKGAGLITNGLVIISLAFVYPALLALFFWSVGLPEDIESSRLLLGILGAVRAVFFALALYVYRKKASVD